jgi:polar amino acid transport system substrate-binding protein
LVIKRWELFMTSGNERRDFLKLGLGGVALGAAATSVALSAKEAAAQSAPDSLIRTVLDRGHLIVGTGSTNAPWHFENDAGELVGMDITMGRIIAKALFDDETKVEFVKQDAQQRIPNIVTGKVDITLQFMTISGARAQLINFTRPYYVEGVALMTRPNSEAKTFDELKAKGSAARVAILQNVDAEATVHKVLPEAQVMQIDTQANVFQALDSNRADARNPDRYFDAGKQWNALRYGGGVRQGDLDWLQFVNTAFSIAMFGHQNELYDKAFNDFFGMQPPERKPGFPTI